MIAIIKILFIANVPSPYRVDFFNELGQYCDLTVLFDREKVDYRKNSWFSFNNENFESVFLKGFHLKNTIISFEIFNYLNLALFDVIIVGGYSTINGMMAILYMNAKKIPFILNSDGGMVKEENFLKYKIKKHFIGSAQTWLSTGKATTDYLKFYGAKKNIFIYPFTSLHANNILNVPIGEEEKNKIKSSLNMNEEKVILSVGRLIPSKGYDILIKAMKNIKKDFGLYIVGGKPTQELVKLKENLQLENVHFIDFKEKNELQKFYKAADIFVLPTRSDVWGLVINEAMANGLPIVTTNKCVAGIELIEDYKNGFIVPVEDSKILSEKINELIHDENMIKKMGKNNLGKISLYTIENMAKITFEIIQDFEKSLK